MIRWAPKKPTRHAAWGIAHEGGPFWATPNLCVADGLA